MKEKPTKAQKAFVKRKYCDYWPDDKIAKMTGLSVRQVHTIIKNAPANCCRR